MLRKILIEPDPILRKKCEPLEKVNINTKKLLDDMLETMYAAPGIGLAAVQIGILKRIVVIDISKKYNIPSNLLKLGESNESAFLTLKLVEIIGEDEAYNLDPETIYFITHLLNQNNLKKIRNEILISALPQRS